MPHAIGGGDEENDGSGEGTVGGAAIAVIRNAIAVAIDAVVAMRTDVVGVRIVRINRLFEISHNNILNEAAARQLQPTSLSQA